MTKTEENRKSTIRPHNIGALWVYVTDKCFLNLHVHAKISNYPRSSILYHRSLSFPEDHSPCQVMLRSTEYYSVHNSVPADWHHQTHTAGQCQDMPTDRRVEWLVYTYVSVSAPTQTTLVENTLTRDISRNNTSLVLPHAQTHDLATWLPKLNAHILETKCSEDSQVRHFARGSLFKMCWMPSEVSIIVQINQTKQISFINSVLQVK